MATLSSAVLDLQSGDITIKLISSEFSATSTFEVLTLGQLKYIHDVPDNNNSDSSSIRSIQGTIEINCWDTMANGNKFSAQLELLTAPAFCKFEFTDRAGIERFFYFTVKPRNYAKNSIENEVKITLTPQGNEIFTQGAVGFPSVDDLMPGSAITNTFVAGASQVGTTLDIDNGSGGSVSTPPSAGDYIYFSSTFGGKVYKVASSTGTELTLENAILSGESPADNARIYVRKFDYASSACSSGLLQIAKNYIKFALESMLEFLDNADSDVLRLEAVFETYRRSNTDSTLLFRDFTNVENDLDYYITENVGEGTAYALFVRLAALTGSFFGTGFGKSWFVPRIFQGQKKTLTSDDIDNVEQIEKTINFKTITVGIFQPTGENEFNGVDILPGVGVTITDTEFVSDSNTLRYSANPQKLFAGEYSGDSDPVTLLPDIDPSFSDSDFVNAIANSGWDSYWIAKGHSATSLYLKASTDYFDVAEEIKFKVFGVVNLLPYQAVDFNSSVESIFQSKIYRPYQLTYDFIEDTVDVRAYRIS